MTTQPAAATAAPTTAAELDRSDPLAAHRGRFLGLDDTDVVAYLDGNSLGRPLAAALDRVTDVVADAWGRRLIRSWDDSWFDLPITLGDRIGEVVLGAAAGQVAVTESTTVSLYKLIRAALQARPDRSEIVIDRANFPTDRFVVEGIAAETGAVIRWIDVAPDGGPTVEIVEAALGPATAVVVLSHVAYRSGHLADIPAITEAVHAHGALVLWDLCHSVGVVPLELDAWGVDLATGCTYKYLNGGPGSPSFLYARRALIASLRQPIQGWMGVKDAFMMGDAYDPADGIRRFVSGTPSVLSMTPMQPMLDLIAEVGIDAIRAKSIALTEYAIARIDRDLLPLGVVLASPRAAAQRGGHVTIDHPSFPAMIPSLWEAGVIPDFRRPTGIRLGLSPLSTSFAEVDLAIDAIQARLTASSPVPPAS